MTHPTDEELDALVELLRNHWLGPHDDARAADAITTIRAQLAEMKADRDAVAEGRDMMGRLWEKEKSRADRAKAALAAQIEADALVCDELAAACAMALALAAKDTPEVRTAVAYSIKIAKRCAATIRRQPHDRTALDRMLAEAREKALREAADMFDADSNIAQTIRALIEADHAQP